VPAFLCYLDEKMGGNMESRLNSETLALYNDKLFPNLTIKQFAARQLHIPEEGVLYALFHALPVEKQTIENKALLEKAMNLSVNASGAIILMVNTNQGLRLVYAESQRRKRVVSSNGACEASESMAQTALREFVEELGNPSERGILCSIVFNPKNCRSLEVTDKIGVTAEAIAARIIEKKADKNGLYVNVSALYVNSTPVNIRHLEQEIEQLNEKLKTATIYYQPAVHFLFGDRATGVQPADFKDATKRAEAFVLINDFVAKCRPSITANFAALFALRFDPETNPSVIKDALLAIVDLTENKAVGLLPKAELEELLSRDLTQKATLDEFKKQYFVASFENILLHKGKRTPSEFLASLENLASQVSVMTLGLPVAETVEAVAPDERKVVEFSS
jgi:hypothetical protein